MSEGFLLAESCGPVNGQLLWSATVWGEPRRSSFSEDSTPRTGQRRRAGSGYPRGFSSSFPWVNASAQAGNTDCSHFFNSWGPRIEETFCCLTTGPHEETTGKGQERPRGSYGAIKLGSLKAIWLGGGAGQSDEHTPWGTGSELASCSSAAGLGWHPGLLAVPHSPVAGSPAVSGAEPGYTPGSPGRPVSGRPQLGSECRPPQCWCRRR